MKILLATTSHVSVLLLKGQFKYLKQAGMDVHFCSSYSELAERSVLSEGAVFHPINFSRTISPLKDLLCLFQCIKLLLKLKPNIINVGTPKAGLLFMIAGFLTGIKIRIFTLRGLRSIEMTGFIKSVMLMMEKLSIKLSTCTVCISPSLKQYVIDEFNVIESKVYVFGKGSSNGVDLKRFNFNNIDPDRVNQLTSEFNLDESKITLGYVGRMVNDKGLRELIDAFTSLGDNAQLILIGDTGEEDVLSSEYFDKININKQIHYLGPKSNVEDFYPLFDVLILYSYREGFGNVVIEAAALGVPSIVSNIIGARDTIIDNETGWLVEAKNSNLLKNKLLELISDKNRLLEAGIKAREFATLNFSNEQVWQDQLFLYKYLCTPS